MENREKESPARTIDSRGSTNASMETIVDRNSICTTTNTNNHHHHHHQTTSETIIPTTPTPTPTTTTNHNHHQHHHHHHHTEQSTPPPPPPTTATATNKNSLTNSQISMISNDPKDPQHHIYTSPDLVLGPAEKRSLRKFKEELVPIKPIAEDEMKLKLATLKAKGKSLDLISVKSSIPPKEPKKRQPFPMYIVLGIIQLVLSISLVALGSLLIIRDAALSTTGSGIWSGGVAAIAGALGVINIGRSKTGFLAVSLICVATSTLAMALTGTGLVRDINRMDQQEFNLMNTEAAVSAGSGLIFALALHLLVSIISVYQSATKLCSSESDENAQMLENVITVNNSAMINQQKVEEYFNSMSASDKEKILSGDNIDKLMTMWMYSSKRGGARPPPPSSQHQQQQQLAGKKMSSRPIILVPATAGNGLPPQMLPPGCRHPGILVPAGMMPYPQAVPPPPPQFQIPLVGPPSAYRPMPISSRAASEISRRHHSKRRTGRSDANRRQRRKSDSDAENRKAFTYTGLDRTIANRFLERQEQSNGSHLDYSSSSDSFRDGCPDVAM